MDISYNPERQLTAWRRRFERLDRRLFLALLLSLTLLAMWLPAASAYFSSQFDLRPGDVADELVRAPRTITYENAEETVRRQEQAAEAVGDVYAYDSTVLPKAVQSIGAFFDSAALATASERAAAEAAGRPYDPAMAAARIQELTGRDVSMETLVTLAALDPARLSEVRRQVLEGVQKILEGNVSETSLAADKARLEAVLEASALTPAEKKAAAGIGSSFIIPNNILDEDLTRQAQAAAAANVQPAMMTLRSGETIVSPGQVVTGDDMAALQALGLTGRSSTLGTIAGLALMLALELLLLALYVRRFEKRVWETRSRLLMVSSLLVLFMVIDRLSTMESLSPLIVPMSALGMLGTLMLRSRLSVIMVVIASVNLAAVGADDPEYFITALFGGLAGVFLVTNVMQRRDLLRAGLLAALVVVAAAVASSQISEASWSRAGSAVLWGLANGTVAIVTTVGLLTIYEMIFNLPTPLKLLELSDPTRPLLKELMIKAPGTYNHSIIMGNIAETAAEAIGANPLLARVGAYYHDIGKLNRPDYFIENQFHVENPHDRLTPSLSRLAIAAHVKDGVRLAREEGLPREILDIIEEHHGTTVLSYFYHKAKVVAGEKPVSEGEYRYAGRKPSSRESAIIMLADSVEAAVRAQKHPTMRNIKAVISEIFSQRLRDGQLSESQMVFGDLEKVRRVFEKCLRGFGATRIPYPEDESGPAETARAGAGGQGPVLR